MQQQCGQTWLQTAIAETHNSDYSVVRQLPFTGAVTWNDYDEGGEIETGIANCLSLSASVSGSILSWNLNFSASSGSENTVDHYIVFDSSDGQNLTPKATLLPGTHSVDLNTLTLASGSHILYVKAVGKPSLQNQMSNSVSYTVASAPPPPPACTDFSLAANPASLNLARGSSANAQISLSSSCGYAGTVNFTASVATSLKGISVSLSSSSASGPSGGTVLTVSVGGKPQTGTGTITVAATDPSIPKSVAVSIALRVQ